MKKINLLLQTSFLLLWMTGCAVESKPHTIEGKVSLPNSLANQMGPSDILYVLAYPDSGSPATVSASPESQGSRETKPLAVRKIAPVVFPAKYELSREDIIFPEKKFEGLLNIVARIHRNPESMPTQKGNLEGLAKKNPVQPGSKNVDIILGNP